MRKLKFIAIRQQDAVKDCQNTQQYVTQLLVNQLGDFGFQTSQAHDDSHIAVSVTDHPVELGVNCQATGEQGALVCEIQAHADETQDWFQKIETQSMIKQLAQAVEETLKNDTSLTDFEWKTGD
jgi:hypothetical protein